MRRKGGGKERRQSRYRAVHETDETGLNDLQEEELAARILLFEPGIRGEMLQSQPVGKRGVALLRRGEVVQELLDRRIGGPFRRLGIEAYVFELENLGALAHRIEAHLLLQPYRLVLDEAADVASPDQRNEIAEFLPIGFGQSAPVFMLLFRHFDKHIRGSRKFVPELVGEGRISARIIVLARDREGQDLLFGQV